MRNSQDAVTEYIAAYNAGDVERLLRVCDDAIFVIHHNRPEFQWHGKAAYRQALQDSKRAVSDKHFADRRGLYVCGETVIVAHTCRGVATQDIPGIAKCGAAVALELCTLFTVRDGLIVEYHDYG